MRTILLGSLAVLIGVLATGSTHGDIGIEVPVGTALDWDKELHQPTPLIKTGIPGRKVGGGEPSGKHKKGDVTKLQGPKIRPTPPPAMNFTIPNLYNFFRITTEDIMNHVSPKHRMVEPVPIHPEEDPTPMPPPNISTGTSKRNQKKVEQAPLMKMTHGVKGFYPPKIPGELAWLSIATQLRADLHPRTTNKWELIAYALELGEPSLLNAERLVKDLITDLPSNRPAFPSPRDPLDRMLCKIVTLELISGYPLSMDPTYCKKTTLMGELARNSLVECAKSQHMFLARNAVVVLGNMPGKVAGKALRDQFKNTRDMCKKIRCAAGLARQRDKKALPLLKSAATSGHNALRAMCIYSIGSIAQGDAKMAKWLAAQVANGDRDLKWTMLSAIARIAAKDPKVAEAVVAIKNEVRGAILSQVALLAAAASGDQASKDAAVAKGGIDEWHPQARILAAEILPHCGDAGLTLAQSLSTYEAENVAVAAVKAAGEFKKSVPWLKQIATSGRPMVRAAALTRLFMHDTKALIEIARGIVAGGYGGRNPAQAFLIGMALQMLDRLGANKGEAVLNLVRQCMATNAIASRTATDEYDVTKARIDIHPPLLELAVLSLGATGHEPGLDTLVHLLEKSAVQAEAAFALGSYGGHKSMARAAEALLKALVDPRDGFTRFAAYLSLKSLSGKDYQTDYVFGRTPDIWRQMLKYREWLVEYQEKYGKGE